MVGSNEGSNHQPSNSNAHDTNTDDIHLTTAFPTPSTTSSDPILTNNQDFLLPPVVIPPQITNDIIEDTVEVASINNEVPPVENVNVDSFTGKKVFRTFI